MRERYFSFKTSDGEVKILSIKDAQKESDPAIKRRILEIIENSQNIRRKKDGFQPGWQENINEYCGDRRQYNEALKRQGLVEIGNDYIPSASKEEYNYCHTDEFVQSCIDSGVELSGNEVDAIKSGEYFKD